MINHINGHDITDKKRLELITDARKARRNARRAMRSGNPAKRAMAAKVYAGAPEFIRQVMVEDHKARYAK